MSGSYNLVRVAGAFIVSLVCASHKSAQSAPVSLVGPAVSAVDCFSQTDFVVAGKHNFALVALEGSNVVRYPSVNTIKKLHESDAVPVLNSLYFRNASVSRGSLNGTGSHVLYLCVIAERVHGLVEKQQSFLRMLIPNRRSEIV